MDRLLSLKRVARLLDCRPAVVDHLTLAGQMPMPVMLPGGRARWRQSQIRGWIANLEPIQLYRLTHPNGIPTPVPPPAPAPAPAPVPVPAPRSGPPTRPLDDDAQIPALGRAILSSLARLGVGQWMCGQEIAQLIGADTDPTSGSWRRVVRRLREQGWIESHRTYGYRLLRPLNQPEPEPEETNA